MSTTKRARRHARVAGLTPEMEEALVSGCDWATARGKLPPLGDMRAAWAANRDALMKAYTEPGMRPMAYFVFDLRDPEPESRLDQIDVLRDRELLDETEALAIERSFIALSPGRDANTSFDDVKKILAMQRGEGMLSQIRRDFEIAARWHRWRGREELAEAYWQRARNCETAELKLQGWSDEKIARLRKIVAQDPAPIATPAT